jgi:hypothetical protein
MFFVHADDVVIVVSGFSVQTLLGGEPLDATDLQQILGTAVDKFTQL